MNQINDYLDYLQEDILIEQFSDETIKKWTNSIFGGPVQMGFFTSKSLYSTFKHGGLSTGDTWVYAFLAGIWPVYRILRAIVDKCTRQCGVFAINEPGRQYCLLKCKINSLESLYNKVKNINCSVVKKEAQCLAAKKEKIESLQMRIRNAKDRFEELKKELQSMNWKRREPK